MEIVIGILKIKFVDALGRQHDASTLTAYIDCLAQ